MRTFPIRTCVACRKKMDQSRLNRVVVRNGSLVADARGILDGRGAYVCSSLACLKNGLFRGGFSRSFKMKLEGIEALRMARIFQNELRSGLEARKSAFSPAEKGVLDATNPVNKDALSFRLAEWERELESAHGGESVMEISSLNCRA